MFDSVFANLPLLLEGFVVTVELALLGGVVSIVIGTVIGLFRVAPFAPLRAIGTAYVEFFRNTPLLVHLFFYYHALPKVGIRLDGFTCGMIGLAIYSGAFVAEAVRAGVQAIGRGQVEASRSLGLSYLQTMRYVVLPQAFTIVLPPLGNIFISLVKNTALVSTIAVADLMYNGEIVESRTFRTFEIFTAIAIMYLILIAPLTFGVSRLERRLARSR
ncbi:MAG: amino acid ABC transporter permease [Chloroflexi bacterium]|nr:amino acid ABC transporter permease [Chloroflexota bacterium]